MPARKPINIRVWLASAKPFLHCSARWLNKTPYVNLRRKVASWLAVLPVVQRHTPESALNESQERSRNFLMKEFRHGISQ